MSIKDKYYLFTINKGYEKNEIEFYIYKDGYNHNNGYFTERRSYDYSGTYHPEQYVYTGATVGGVHTGGVHKEEAYVSVRKSTNGNGEVVYHNNDRQSDISVDSVTLSDELVVEAKKNPTISKMLKGNVIELLKPMTPAQASAFRAAVSSYDRLAIANIGTARYYSYDVCKEVVRFLKTSLCGAHIPELAEVVAEKNKKEKRNTSLAIVRCIGLAIIGGILGGIFGDGNPGLVIAGMLLGVSVGYFLIVMIGYIVSELF